jgi:hypothetical protein
MLEQPSAGFMQVHAACVHVPRMRMRHCHAGSQASAATVCHHAAYTQAHAVKSSAQDRLTRITWARGVVHAGPAVGAATLAACGPEAALGLLRVVRAAALLHYHAGCHKEHSKEVGFQYARRPAASTPGHQ